jgi:hypothetical protein
MAMPSSMPVAIQTTVSVIIWISVFGGSKHGRGKLKHRDA